MRAYKVHVQYGIGMTATKYAGTQAEVREARRSFVDEFSVKKKDVTTEEVEIPTAKAELLDFINSLVG